MIEVWRDHRKEHSHDLQTLQRRVDGRDILVYALSVGKNTVSGVYLGSLYYVYGAPNVIILNCVDDQALGQAHYIVPVSPAKETAFTGR